ncbi:MAG: hemerythrin domain-containing protein [Leptospiraceae bacterium]|nr:hemerythrin domain-containing protein [Leptospiraceae bacterium]
MQSLERELSEKSVWPVERLVQYLQSDHQRFLEEELPRLHSLANAVKRKSLIQFLDSMRTELQGHFKTEENIVFPVLISMENQDPGPLEPALLYACRHMKSDHRMHEKHLKTLAAFQNEMDEDRDNPVVLPLVNALEDFGRRMLLHLTIENRFLFKPYLPDTNS